MNLHKKISLIIIAISCPLFGQLSSWKILDPKVNKDIIVAYRQALDQYNEENETSTEKRLVFRFGETEDSVNDKLYSRDLILNYNEENQHTLR